MFVEKCISAAIAILALGKSHKYRYRQGFHYDFALWYAIFVVAMAYFLKVFFAIE